MAKKCILEAVALWYEFTNEIKLYVPSMFSIWGDSPPPLWNARKSLRTSLLQKNFHFVLSCGWVSSFQSIQRLILTESRLIVRQRCTCKLVVCAFSITDVLVMYRESRANIECFLIVKETVPGLGSRTLEVIVMITVCRVWSYSIHPLNQISKHQFALSNDRCPSSRPTASDPWLIAHPRILKRRVECTPDLHQPWEESFKKESEKSSRYSLWYIYDHDVSIVCRWQTRERCGSHSDRREPSPGLWGGDGTCIALPCT